MKYKAIFFDWDGTAVKSRRAPVEHIIKPMEDLLKRGIKLIIISGTTYENIAGGKLHEFFQAESLKNLYMGLGRGAVNYSFQDGNPVCHPYRSSDMEERLLLHKICFDIHQYLLKKHSLNTDIVFTRPNYCKIDLMPDNDRGEQLFLQTEEISRIEKILSNHGLNGGLQQLIALAEQVGKEQGVDIQVTTDAKYLEVGSTTKSDNINYFAESLLSVEGIKASECCFFGDEFTYLTKGVRGSDAYMINEFSKEGDFFDVSANPLSLPEQVIGLSGGIERFKEFLIEQSH